MNDKGIDCTVSVDGTNFRILEREKLWYSHKFKKSAVRYKVGLCILTGKIVWVHGPFNCGEWNHLSIFHYSLLSHHLQDAGERGDVGRSVIPWGNTEGP